MYDLSPGWVENVFGAAICKLQIFHIDIHIDKFHLLISEFSLV